MLKCSIGYMHYKARTIRLYAIGEFRDLVSGLFSMFHSISVQVNKDFHQTSRLSFYVVLNLCLSVCMSSGNLGFSWFVLEFEKCWLSWHLCQALYHNTLTCSTAGALLWLSQCCKVSSFLLHAPLPQAKVHCGIHLFEFYETSKNLFPWDWFTLDTVLKKKLLVAVELLPSSNKKKRLQKQSNQNVTVYHCGPAGGPEEIWWGMAKAESSCSFIAARQVHSCEGDPGE